MYRETFLAQPWVMVAPCEQEKHHNCQVSIFCNRKTERYFTVHARFIFILLESEFVHSGYDKHSGWVLNCVVICRDCFESILALTFAPSHLEPCLCHLGPCLCLLCVKDFPRQTWTENPLQVPCITHNPKQGKFQEDTEVLFQFPLEFCSFLMLETCLRALRYLFCIGGGRE